MPKPKFVEKAFHHMVDSFYAIWPQPLPSRHRVAQAKIVSHRGEHDNREIIENTIPAFDKAAAAGVTGIEFDVRWTKDLHPVVFHDKDLQRLFNSGVTLGEITLKELISGFPLIPTLKDIINRYGRKLHLMLEIKAETYPDPVYQNEILETLFARLTPRKDYHLITLTPHMFEEITFVSSKTFLLIAQLNFRNISRLTSEREYAGMLGHYLFVTDKMIRKHHHAKQQMGTGYIKSRKCLWRELNRGVEWIFSNNAAELQSICRAYING